MTLDEELREAARDPAFRGTVFQSLLERAAREYETSLKLTHAEAVTLLKTLRNNGGPTIDVIRKRLEDLRIPW